MFPTQASLGRDQHGRSVCLCGLRRGGTDAAPVGGQSKAPRRIGRDKPLELEPGQNVPCGFEGTEDVGHLRPALQIDLQTFGGNVPAEGKEGEVATTGVVEQR